MTDIPMWAIQKALEVAKERNILRRDRNEIERMKVTEMRRFNDAAFRFLEREK